MSPADRALFWAEKMRRFSYGLVISSVDQRDLEAILRELADGYVPREPTAAMMKAGDVAWDEADHSDYVAMCGVIWRAMHDAHTGRGEG